MSSPDEVWTSRNSKMKILAGFFWPLRVATLYERQVARIGLDSEQPLAGPLAMATTSGSVPTTGEDLDKRSDLVVKRCRDSWLGLCVLGVPISWYATRES